MARQLRYNLINIPQYITQLGINRQSCFFSDEDYYYYLECLYDAAQKWRCQIHAYSLLENRILLLMTPKMENAISRCMQSVNRRYVRYINIKYSRRGTLWSGRYTASPIEADLVLDCYHHIERAPISAAIVKSADDYMWSSYNAHTNGTCSPIIDDHTEYLKLANDKNKRKVRYLDYFKTKITESENKTITKAIRYGRIIGSDTFKHAIETTPTTQPTQKQGHLQKTR